MRSAFTLLELLVVLVIVVLLTSVVAVRMQAPYANARLAEVLKRIEFVDGQARGHAHSFAVPWRLTFDLDRGRIYAQRTGSHDERHCELVLPDTLRIRHVVTLADEVGSGTVHINVSPRGVTETYAVCVSTQTGSASWLLFAGVSGQVSSLEEFTDVQRVLEPLRAASPDTP
jgi:prepilin-type N-terminal cleavage/methylation domain-containing protein